MNARGPQAFSAGQEVAVLPLTGFAPYVESSSCLDTRFPVQLKAGGHQLYLWPNSQGHLPRQP